MFKICNLALPFAVLAILTASPSAADESRPCIGDVTNGTALYRRAPDSKVTGIL